jgi:hypothetical protein
MQGTEQYEYDIYDKTNVSNRDVLDRPQILNSSQT